MKHIYMSILNHLYEIGDIEETNFYGNDFAHIEFSDDEKRYSVSIREIKEEEDVNNG